MRLEHGSWSIKYDFLVADNNHLSNEDLINLFQVHNSEYDMTALSYAVSNNNE